MSNKPVGLFIALSILGAYLLVGLGNLQFSGEMTSNHCMVTKVSTPTERKNREDSIKSIIVTSSCGTFLTNSLKLQENPLLEGNHYQLNHTRYGIFSVKKLISYKKEEGNIIQ